MSSINWSNFFKTRQDNNLGNFDLSIFSKAWSQQTTSIEKAAFISNDANLVVLAANTNKSMAVLHGFKNLRGSPLRPVNKCVCFGGTSINATVVIIDMVSLTKDINIRGPSIIDSLD
jgi:hypothetical protein